jgi:hypothetical protein
VTGRRPIGARSILLGPGIVIAAFAVMLGSVAVPAPANGAFSMPTFAPFSVNASETPPTGPIPLTVAFSALAAGGVGPYDYNWSFGDGSANATVASANHTYLWVATFYVNVTAVDALGEIATHSLAVRTTPAQLLVSVSATPSALAAGATTYLVTIVHGGSTPYHFAWTGLPIGCPSQAVQNLSCTPRYGGSYVVNVTVTDSAGVAVSSTVGLVVTGAGPPTPPPPTSQSPDFTLTVVAVAAIGIVAVGVAAWVGRRVRRRRDRPGA